MGADGLREPARLSARNGADPRRARTGGAAGLTGDDVCLVAELDGEVVGLVLANPAATSAWATGRINAKPVTYLALGSTTAHARGKGVAGAIVAELHRRQSEQGIAATALHYSAYNPLSVPFWSQQGYRPLLTSYSTTVH
ncbi:MAG: GNAT family N-acetyltransferase [Jatrophihabitans sp.]